MTRIIIFFFILVGIGIGIKTDAAIFNWSRGEPKVLGNSDTTYFSWRAGEPAVFYNLYNLEIGNQIQIIDVNNNQYNFYIYDKQVYPYDQSPVEQIFGQSTDKNLNLITCSGWFNQSTRNYSHRLIVFSRLVE